tara:strand:+ start:143 stop:469 length:327 start_codon:yes stop_codon:yes gene_type:complete
MVVVLMCDPPSGWKYGFPKPVPLHVDTPTIVRGYFRGANGRGRSDAFDWATSISCRNLDASDCQVLPCMSLVPFKKWLVSEGYPQSEIDDYGGHFYCRYYEMEIDDEQ